MNAISKTDVANWLYGAALPFWAEHGIDPAGHGAWEALSHEGLPLTSRDKRIRVHPRQTYVFAKAAARGHPQYLPIAQGLFDYTMQHGFTSSGRLIDVTTPDGQVQGQPHRLYDLAFVLLASAAMTQAGAVQIADLDQAQAALDVLDTAEGWANDAGGQLPRTQNPHMHLFEAATDLFAATAAPHWKGVADRVLGLFKSHFLRSDGAILEFFDPDWQPVTEGQQVEPGHIFEWIWLLDQYEIATGTPTGVDTEAMFRTALKSQNQNNHFPDTSEPASQTHRLWVQCEAIKASLVMSKRGFDIPATATPQHLMEVLFVSYLRAPVAGGWYDSLGEAGQIVSKDMPSSSLYHVYVALQAYMDLT